MPTGTLKKKRAACVVRRQNKEKTILDELELLDTPATDAAIEEMLRMNQEPVQPTKGLSKEQKAGIFAAVVAFLIAIAQVFGFEIPVVPGV